MKKISVMLAVLFVLLGTVEDVRAHEKREMPAGPVWVVGFINEPAFAGSPNGIDLQVRDQSGNPMEGLEKTLNAEVLTPDRSQSVPLNFETRYGKPGYYAAYFTPAVPGDYVFRIRGSLNGHEVDQTFASGPGTFGAVRETVMFPPEQSAV